MKKLFETVRAWLRSRVTAIVRVKGDGLMVKGESEKAKGEKASRKQPIPVASEAFPLRGNKKGAALTLPEVQAVLCHKYELRYNLLSEQSEYRERGSEGDFLPITKRVYMTWLMDIQAEGYNYTWLEGVRIAAESLHIPSYHPVTQYFATLPQWDGTDRLRPLMMRLTTDDTMVDYLCRWMLALVAQAQGRTDAVYANSVAPLLVSEQQGMHKSTFCRMLLPPELREYYTDNFDLTAESQCERKLLDCLLINLDEFDRYSSRKQSTLKNLMQMTSLRMRKAYRNHSVTLPRIASFIGTSNTANLLTDPTGSRRFLCIDIREMIDVDTPIDHPQLGRHQHTAEGALVPSLLLADEDGRHAIGIEGLSLTLCLCHEGQHPATEIAYEYLIVREALHQGTQTVGAVPLGQRREVMLHGMVGLDMHRLGSDAHSLDPPHVVPIGLEVGHPGLVHALCHRLVRGIAPLGTILRLLGQQVVAQVILGTQ